MIGSAYADHQAEAKIFAVDHVIGSRPLDLCQHIKLKDIYALYLLCNI